ncbi:hypothetical protein RRG08_017424 [Elysia crispata]|uniref:Fibrinogen C-terminal domain-containing protein n=1 Tax=Elysia crispata TaxID=231223 RepID=A0AAE1EBB6_9GAST|nr:hypothetical protein RRG08_017424 [Elysia crispata]
MWQENDYSLKQFCNVTSDSYSSLSANKSLIHCAIVCSGNDSCAGYTYNNDSSCDLFGDDLWDYNCSSLFEEDNTTISAFVKISKRQWTPQCVNKGSLSATNTCVCVDGWVGDRCNDLMEDCTDGKLMSNYTEDKMYLIKPSLAPEPFMVFCQMSSDPAMTRIQLKVSENMSFNKTWQEFKDGFNFTPQKDFWLGNDKIHYITTSNPHTLVIALVVDDVVYKQYLHDFIMANETEDYAVTYREAFLNSSLELYLEPCWGNDSIEFSTFDRDNDGMTAIDCATEFGAGWWYQAPNCSACNPNGDLYINQTERLGIPSENFWSALPVNNSSPDQVWMALVRNDALWQVLDDWPWP